MLVDKKQFVVTGVIIVRLVFIVAGNGDDEALLRGTCF
jgi:hypothetical protein